MRFLHIAHRANPARPFAVTNYRSYLLLTSGRGHKYVVTNRDLSTPRSPRNREMKNRSDMSLMAVTNRLSERPLVISRDAAHRDSPTMYALSHARRLTYALPARVVEQ